MILSFSEQKNKDAPIFTKQISRTYFKVQCVAVAIKVALNPVNQFILWRESSKEYWEFTQRRIINATDIPVASPNIQCTITDCFCNVPPCSFKIIFKDDVIFKL